MCCLRHYVRCDFFYHNSKKLIQLKCSKYTSKIHTVLFLGLTNTLFSDQIISLEYPYSHYLFFKMALVPRGLPRWNSGKESTCQSRRSKERGIWSLSQEDPLEEEMKICSRILTWKIPWTEEPGRWATVHGVSKSPAQLSMDTHTHTHTHTWEFFQKISLGLWSSLYWNFNNTKSLPNAKTYINTATFNSDIGVAV